MKNLQTVVFVRERPVLLVSGNCNVDHRDDRLVKKCSGNGGGGGISDGGGGGGGDVTVINGENVCRNKGSLVIDGFVIELLFDCIIKLFP